MAAPVPLGQSGYHFYKNILLVYIYITGMWTIFERTWSYEHNEVVHHSLLYHLRTLRILGLLWVV